ncbi:hypothetical protein [Legionella sp. 16cNR16C]|uniref:hypothetical protein n=1 Tax=Legionella sp. 16cNR16C TaxID=2905656 RepID=UPI001E2F971C|nr:hypothetical protein [Legionella sp. 16cNR16C]MCE3045810.1 hypothetical protein [Legionella sp. 16cNR16C]
MPPRSVLTPFAFLNPYKDLTSEQNDKVNELVMNLENEHPLIALNNLSLEEPKVVMNVLLRVDILALWSSFREQNEDPEEIFDKLAQYGPDFSRFLFLELWSNERAWARASDEHYLQMATNFSTIPFSIEEVQYFLRHINPYDYVKLCAASLEFHGLSMKAMIKEPALEKRFQKFIDFKSYPPMLKEQKTSHSNPLTQLSNLISVNHRNFNQGTLISGDKKGFVNKGGECYGITGLWLITDKFVKQFRKLTSNQSDYSNMPMVRRIAALQRAQWRLRSDDLPEANFKAGSSTQKSIAHTIVRDILANPQKDRMQFFYYGEEVAHTMGLRIQHKDKSIVLKYFDANYGTRRIEFTNNAAGIEKAEDFLRKYLNKSGAETLSYLHTSQKEMAEQIESAIASHAIEQEEGIIALQKKALRTVPLADTLPDFGPSVSTTSNKKPVMPSEEKSEAPVKSRSYSSSMWENIKNHSARISRLDTDLTHIKEGQLFANLLKQADKLFDEKEANFPKQQKDRLFTVLAGLCNAVNIEQFKSELAQCKTSEFKTGKSVSEAAQKTADSASPKRHGFFKNDTGSSCKRMDDLLDAVDALTKQAAPVIG